ncbi:MAG: alpha/beta hydrolase, partial [Kiritimatiellae bacterium]|nr:alpha/beta hydrolase [Kiritimatiellia bacterium]
ELPSLSANRCVGWINFPDTRATEPCVHDLRTRRRTVSLPASAGADDLVCTWNGAANVGVENIPPRSATLTASFDPRQSGGVTYALSHPNRLFGQTEYAQTVRYCPRPGVDEPPFLGYGEEVHYDECVACSGTCVGDCGCPASCGCSCCDHGICPVHSVPYEECESLHPSDYEDAATNAVATLAGVLYIRDPPVVGDQVYLEVTNSHVNCCGCPDHWTNYVGIAYQSHRLRVTDQGGSPFGISGMSCMVDVAGVAPSEAVGDAELAFARDGEIYKRRGYTVLGVGIRRDGVPLSRYNELSPSLGFPMAVCTNQWNAPELRLVTNVGLPTGGVRLELEDAMGQFAVWCRDGDGWRKLVDCDSPVADFPMHGWRAVMRGAGCRDSPELPVRLTSSSPGSARLVFRYWNVVAGAFVEDSVSQRITSIRPPLRLDISRDGSIDDGDSAAWLGGRSFYYWVNECKVYGDYIVPGRKYTAMNSSDLVVNGTFDLVNFFPVALDFKPFMDAWGDQVTYVVKPEWPSENSFNFCFADVPWNRAGSIQTTNTLTISGHGLSSAPLAALPAGGVALSDELLGQFSENAGLMVCEATSQSVALRVDIEAGDELLFSYSVPMTILPVKEMYSWINSRSLSGENVVRPTSLHKIWEEQNTKSLIFLHGANVSEKEAESWGDILFKRMWVSGVHADFYNVDWRSDIGGPANYHENASNAFVVASQLATTLSDIPGEKVIMAHSLGNMVVSSMIQDHGLQVSKYIMCNSAVPAEPYDTTLTPTNVLVHKDWNEYPRKAFANEWYKCFEEDVDDDRQLLTWGGRFADVVNVAVNFYSTGDHVLELYPNSNVWPTDGYENLAQMFERYSWHKQELWKGRAGLLFNVGTTDWAGWSIRENMFGYNTIQPTNAWLMSGAELKTNTVFKLQPETMNTNSIPLLLRGALLAKGIPSRTPASGATKWGPLSVNDSMYNLNSTNTTQNGISRPNGWIARPNGLLGNWGDRWLHSDIKDMAYFFVFRVFEKIKEEGGLE